MATEAAKNRNDGRGRPPNVEDVNVEPATVADAQQPERETILAALKRAYDSKQLTIYIGAGVSHSSGLPTWEQLVLSMYFRALSHDNLEGWKPYPNYLFAIAEWYLKKTGEALDVVARKTRLHYGDSGDRFMQVLRETLYAGFIDRFDNHMEKDVIRAANSTLDATAKLCESTGRQHGVRAVVTYNYDDLLESAIAGYPHHSIWNDAQANGDGLPVFHVHGFVPYAKDDRCSAWNEIVFTEDQYISVAQNPYSWSNVVQIQSMSSTVGLMIGLSLSDRNIRRLLQAVNATPVKSECYLILKRMDPPEPAPADLQSIDAKARELLDVYQKSGIKNQGGTKTRNAHDQIRGIVSAVGGLDTTQKIRLLGELGVYPLWVDEWEEIPKLVKQIIF